MWGDASSPPECLHDVQRNDFALSSLSKSRIVFGGLWFRSGSVVRYP